MQFFFNDSVRTPALHGSNLNRITDSVDVEHVPSALLYNLGSRHICVMIVVLVFSLPPLATAVEFKNGVAILEALKAPFQLPLGNYHIRPPTS